jgi:acetylglutamate kinase
MNTDTTYSVIIQPHELKDIARILKQKHIASSEEAVVRFIIEAIRDKVRREWQVDYATPYFKRQQEMEKHYADVRNN